MNIKERKAHPLYYTWKGIMNRSYKRNTIGYDRYGGKGILTPKSWFTFEHFVKDVEIMIGPKPGPQFNIDRINLKDHFSCRNIKWVHEDEHSAKWWRHNKSAI